MLKFNIQILVFETETSKNIFSQAQRPTFRAAKRPKISSADAKLAGIFSSSIFWIKTTNCGHDLSQGWANILYGGPHMKKMLQPRTAHNLNFSL